jgi:V8-like Glu-specific endopeptidase
MKKVLAALSALGLLAACQQAPQLLPQLSLQNPALRAMSAAASLDHPDFVRKMKNPAQYRYAGDSVATRSICGKEDNMQNVNDYNGTLGQPVEFVKKYQAAVGALAMGNPDSSSRKFCSGTLISEDLFLTASHCIDSTITSKFAVFNYEKAPGSSELLPQDHYKIAGVVEDRINGLDFAVLRIEGKPGQKYGWTPIRPVLPEDGHLLTIIQHPKGKVKMIESGPKVAGSGVYMGYTDLDTEPGSSGSGVLDKDGYLVGVHTNGGCYSGGGANRGVKMTEIVKGSKVIQSLAQASRGLNRR